MEDIFSKAAFSRRLREYIAKYYGKNSAFASATGLEESLVSRTAAGESIPKADALAKMQRTGLSIDWVLAGIGECKLNMDLLVKHRGSPHSNEKEFTRTSGSVSESRAPYMDNTSGEQDPSIEKELGEGEKNSDTRDAVADTLRRENERLQRELENKAAEIEFLRGIVDKLTTALHNMVSSGARPDIDLVPEWEQPKPKPPVPDESSVKDGN